jgi:hypothetical protein
MNRVSQGILSMSLFLFGVLLLLSSKNAASYQSSVYGQLSPLFWVTFALLGLLVLVSLVHSSAHRFTPLFTTILLFSIIISLPVLFGFHQYGRADVLVHRGWIADLSLHNSINSLNTYPATHMLAAFLDWILGINLTRSFAGLLLVFYLVSGLCLYCVSCRLLSPRKVLGFFTAIPVLASGHSLITPFHISIQLLPLFFLVLLVDQKRSSFLLIVLLISIAIYHPLTTVSICFILFFLGAGKYSGIAASWEKVRKHISSPSYKSMPLLSTLGIIILYLWMNSQSISNMAVGRLTWRIRLAMVDLLTKKGASASHYSDIQSNFNLTSFPIDSLIQAIMFRVGPWILVGGLVSLFILLWINEDTTTNYIVLQPKFQLSILSIIFFAFGLFSFFIELSGANYQRFARIACILAIPPIVVGMSKLRTQNNPITSIFVILIVVSLLAITPLSIHYSSDTDLRSSQQVTESQVSTMSWIYKFTTEGDVGSFHLNYWKFIASTEGVQEGFSEEERTSQAISSSYFVSSKSGRNSYKRNYAQYPSYFPYDREVYLRFQYNVTKSKIYSTQSTHVYHT